MIYKCSKFNTEFNVEADVCPSCGASFADKEATLYVVIKSGGFVKTFSICNKTADNRNAGQSSIRFTKEIDNYIQIRKPFYLASEQIFRECCNFVIANLRTFEQIYDIGIKFYSNAISATLDTLGIEMLISHDINWYNLDMLENGFASYSELGKGDMLFKDFLSYKQKADDFIETIACQRGYQRSNRTYWQGGGFGIKGALVGKFKADLLNWGTSVLLSIGDSVINSRDRQKIEQYKQECWYGALYPFEQSLRELVRSAGSYIFSVLVNEGVFKPVSFISSSIKTDEMMKEKTKAMAENIYRGFSNGRYTKEQAIDKLCFCISEYPYERSSYSYIYIIEHSTKGKLLEVAKYCGNEEEIANSLELS